MSELVSILIPAYNAEAWLPSTIRSALAQTWPRIEVIVVDDGSTDGTLAVARSFESSKVRVVSQANQGAPAARNKLFELAQGTYIQWLDADDLLAPSKISAQMKVAAAVSDRVLLSSPFGTFYYRPEKAVFTPTALWQDLRPLQYLLTRFHDNVYFQTGAWLVSRALSEAAGTWTDFHSPDDDGEYFCRVVVKSEEIKFVSDARMYYRVGNQGSLAKTRSRQALTALLGSKVKCINHLLAMEDSERTRAAAVQLLRDALANFVPEREDLVAEAQQLAARLGGDVQPPTLKWKYRPVEWLFGRRAATRAAYILPRLKAQVSRDWDGLLYRLSAARAVSGVRSHRQSGC